LKRRAWLQSVLGTLLAPVSLSTRATDFAPVVPGRAIRLPEDEGSHPQFRTEWWYITGWLERAGSPIGFQITFFRTRPHPESGNPSRFNPRDLIIGHAAVSEREHGRLRHAQRVARAGFGLAYADENRMNVRLDDWRLTTEDALYAARIPGDDFELDLRFGRTQPPLLQGENGYSRKGPGPAAASYYYSLPHLAVTGRTRIGKQDRAVSGSAWLDHEWSSEILDPAAVGWDWIGINLDDGSALMAFRMRAQDGSQHWAAATYRTASGERQTFGEQEVRWTVKRRWRSPRTGADYPVALRVIIGATPFDIDAWFDDQENDTRLTTGAVYWEGAAILSREGRRVGRGYLELTGYAGRLRM
jgi:predicted secreted hydrolase